MARLIQLTPTKTYATVKNAVRAVEQSQFGNNHLYGHLTYFIERDEATGRFFPVFLGERAVQAMVHFTFNVAG